MPESDTPGDTQGQIVAPGSSAQPVPTAGTVPDVPAAGSPPPNAAGGYYVADPSASPESPATADTPADSSDSAPPAPEALPDTPEEAPAPYQDAITWTASEFIAHHKTPGWYGLLGLAAVAAAGLVYLATRDIISSSVVIVAAIFFGIFAARQPRQLEYALDDSGVHIGDKYYSLGAFRSFSVVPEGAFSSVIFMPLKRFAPLTTIYFAPEDEPRIVDLLSASLPFEDYRHDAIDRLLRRIRF